MGYLGKDVKPDFTIWQLAVGKDADVRKLADFFGLRYEVDENDKAQFNHSLRTAVIGPDGKIIAYTIVALNYTLKHLKPDFWKNMPYSPNVPAYLRVELMKTSG